jgi:large subunit ribosomal protein L10e
MARLRKFVAYRTLERPYTRKSKYRTKNFVRAFPHNTIVRYVMGAVNKEFPFTVYINSKQDLQVRHNSLEAARQVAVKYLESNFGKTAFYLRLHKFPHHVLRENPLASGAGADRLSTGMKMSFGKPIGIAAQVRQGETVYEVRTENLAAAKRAATLIKSKMPGSWAIVEKKAPVAPKAAAEE